MIVTPPPASHNYIKMHHTLTSIINFRQRIIYPKQSIGKLSISVFFFLLESSDENTRRHVSGPRCLRSVSACQSLERVSRPALSMGPHHAKAACLLRRDFKRFNTCSLNYATAQFSAACMRLSPVARGTLSVSSCTEQVQELMARHGIREEVHALPFSCSIVRALVA